MAGGSGKRLLFSTPLFTADVINQWFFAFSKVIKNNYANKTKALPYPNPTHTTTQDITLTDNSGATDLFVTQADAESILQHMQPCDDMNVELPNGQVITSIAEGVL